MLAIVKQYLEEKKLCPHCKNVLTLCHAPPMHIGDGLGWGAEYLFICLNDDCPLFVNGWEYIENQYGHVGSYRHMEVPGGGETYNMMVAGKEAFTGSIVDIEALLRQDQRYAKIQAAVARLDGCVARGELEPVLFLLLEEHASLSDRKRAVEMLVALSDLACIEPLRLHRFKNTDLEQLVNLAIARILADHFLKECPYCAELIKARAMVCKHCQREVA